MRADTSSHHFRIWSPVVTRFLCGLEQDGHPGLSSNPLGFSFLRLTRWAAHCLSASYRLVLPQCSSYLWAFRLLEKKRKEGGKKSVHGQRGNGGGTHGIKEWCHSCLDLFQPDPWQEHCGHSPEPLLKPGSVCAFPLVSFPCFLKMQHQYISVPALEKWDLNGELVF